MRGFVKWVCAPIASALLGFYFIGPHYAGDSKPVKMVQEAKAVAQSRLAGTPSPSEAAPSEPKPSETPPQVKASEAPAPRVSVGVEPADADVPSPRRRRRRHRAAVSDEAPPEATPERERTGPDPASTP